MESASTLAGQPKLEVADIFRRFPGFLYSKAQAEAKVGADILNCRTHVLGGHKQECEACAYSEYSYNSCRNRHCPKCQFLTRMKWVEARKSELLPVQYFHVVFTVPHALNAILWENKKIGFDILFRAAAETLQEVGERKLDAQLGFTAVLHTWSQKLLPHAHLHVVVPGGGLSRDGKRWVSAKQDYLLPIKVLSKVFEGKFLEYLEAAFLDLKFEKNPRLRNRSTFKEALIEASKQDWVVYAKAPFAGPKQVIEYLGNYTHRIAIANSRLESFDGESVTFRYRDSENGNAQSSLRLPAAEFLNRFLSHALPPKFVRLRHYGFLASRSKSEKLETARTLLSARRIEKAKDSTWQAALVRIMGVDITLCPCCGSGHLREVSKLLPHKNLRPRIREDSS